MKPICFIGARGGSKGVPRKNLRDFNGKPLIAHTIEKTLDSGIFSHVIVSTEDNEIASIARKFGAEVPFMRPKKFATDTASFEDVLFHGLTKLYKLGYKFEIFVNRDCTVPFIRNQDVDGTIKLLQKEKCHGVFGVYKQHHNPYFNMMEENSKGFLQFSKKLKNRPLSRQKSPIVYQLNGLFTMYAKRFLKARDIFTSKILPYEIPPETGLMIDTEFEFWIAESTLKNKYF